MAMRGPIGAATDRAHHSSSLLRLGTTTRDTKVSVAERSSGMVGSGDDDDTDDFSFDDYQMFPKEGTNTKYRRVMLKLSGEALQGDLGFGVDPKVLGSVARDIAECQMRGVQVSSTTIALLMQTNAFLHTISSMYTHCEWMNLFTLVICSQLHRLLTCADGCRGRRRKLLPWRQCVGGPRPRNRRLRRVRATLMMRCIIGR